MAAKSVARKLKRARRPAAKLAVTGTAAAVAAGLALGSAPLASGALDITQQVLTAGPLVNLLPGLGITSIGPISLGNLPIVGDATLTLTLAPIAYDTQSIYNTINALPFQRRSGLSSTRPFDRVYGTSGATAGQFPAILGSGIGTGNTVETYRNQLAAIANNGVAANGLTPFQPSPVNGAPNETNQALLLLRNPYRPNGGIQARFAPVLNLFGVDTAMPAAGKYTSPDGKLILNTATLDVSWAYDPLSDFPVTLNPFAIANSLLAGLPTNLLGGLNGQVFSDPAGNPVTLTDLGLNIASVLGILNRETAGIAGIDAGKAYYGMLRPNDLPLLEPLRLPSRIINLLTGLDLPTPIADALQPALTILVNTGYSDVITPADAPSDPTKWYTRSYLTAGIPEPFLSVSPLTFQEWTRVPGDVFNALVKGFSDVFIPRATPPQVSPGAAATPPVSVTSGAAAARLITADVETPEPQAITPPAPQAITPQAPREAEVAADVAAEAPGAPVKVTRPVRTAVEAVKAAAGPAVESAVKTPAATSAADADDTPAPKPASARAARSAR